MENKSVAEDAYLKAELYAKKHYENFPVVSFLIPKRLRKHVAIIYWFARTADDLADEGNFTIEERLEKLDEFEKRLSELLQNNFESPFEFALSRTIEDYNLTPDLFFDLLKAFKRDVTKNRYSNFDDVLDYCKYSANPVGRLILELFGIRSDKAFRYSDKICTALQLTNFYQDTKIDFEKGRIYLPQDEMEKFGADEKMFEINKNNLNLKRLLEYNIDRTQQFFNEGKKLFPYLKGLLKFEIKWTVLGGEAILKRIKKNNFNVLDKRPKLSKPDFIFLLLKAFVI